MSIYYLRRSDILLINSKTIREHGGNYNPPENLLHPESLNYVLEAVSSSMFGQAMYPTVADKAAVYMYNIIGNHIFSDGNKRTGLEAALLFLKLNGFLLKDNLQIAKSVQSTTEVIEGEDSDDLLINFTLEVAAGQLSLDEVRHWFAENIEPRT